MVTTARIATTAHMATTERKARCMSESQVWNDVDDYFTTPPPPPDAPPAPPLPNSAAAGPPPITVAPTRGKLPQPPPQTQGARRILEIGTLGGYSTIWL